MGHFKTSKPQRKTVLVSTLVLLTIASSSASAQDFGAAGVSNSGGEEPKTPFEFEYFDELLGTIPEKERERLCGLDKVCVELWRKGKLQIFKEGRLIEGDFNEDGITEEAMILETDSVSDATQKDYWIYVSQPESEGPRIQNEIPEKSGTPPLPEKLVKGHKILLHEPIPDAFNVIDFFWDPKRKGLVIDIGERLMRSSSNGLSDPSQVTGVVQSGVAQKVVVVVTWNSKSNKFDLIVPIKGLKHRKRNA